MPQTRKGSSDRQPGNPFSAGDKKMTKLRVGFFSSQNYLDKNTFSGTLYYMYRALHEQNLNILNLGNPYPPTRRASLWKRLTEPLQSRVHREPQNAESQLAEKKRKFALQVQKELSKKTCDLLFAPVASSELSYLNVSIPVVYVSDATPRLLDETYTNFYKSREEFSRRAAQEKIAIAKATTSIYSSQWAADSAIQDYGAEAAKVQVISFGANIDSPPSASDIYQKCDRPRCRLLFIGKDWQRKGGNIAYETLLALLEKGVDTELVMLGSVPPEPLEHERLRIIPFLNKNIKQERDRFEQLLLESHFLMFPTRADCSPISICEANAFGVPVMTTDVGGIPTIMRSGQNGYMFPLSATPEDYGKAIAEVFQNRERYRELVRSCRAEYDLRLNWGTWARKVVGVMENLVSSQ